MYIARIGVDDRTHGQNHYLIIGVHDTRQDSRYAYKYTCTCTSINILAKYTHAYIYMHQTHIDIVIQTHKQVNHKDT